MTHVHEFKSKHIDNSFVWSSFGSDAKRNPTVKLLLEEHQCESFHLHSVHLWPPLTEQPTNVFTMQILVPDA